MTAAALPRFRRWLAEQALPFWATAGFDPAAGRFHERLDAAGRAIDVPLRAMVQARQIFVYAEAARTGLFADGGDLAERAMATLVRDHAEASGAATSFAFAVDRSGTTLSPIRDAYAHAFLLLAIAALHRLTGDPKLLTLADRIIRFIEGALHDPVQSGLFDAHPIVDRGKRQNPVMHLLEAYLLLERAAPDRGYIDRATGLVALAQHRFVDTDAGTLLEHFAEDWSDHPDEARARIWEPGHHFEWVWLLREHALLAGEEVVPIQRTLHATALAHGIGARGLIHDELGADLGLRKSSNRLWPHTEAIKAAVAMRGIDPDAEALAERMAAALLDHFLDRPFAGGWIDHRDAAGAPLVDYVPASSLYHLALAANEAAALDRALA